MEINLEMVQIAQLSLLIPIIVFWINHRIKRVKSKVHSLYEKMPKLIKIQESNPNFYVTCWESSNAIERKVIQDIENLKPPLFSGNCSNFGERVNKTYEWSIGTIQSSELGYFAYTDPGVSGEHLLVAREIMMNGLGSLKETMAHHFSESFDHLFQAGGNTIKETMLYFSNGLPGLVHALDHSETALAALKESAGLYVASHVLPEFANAEISSIDTHLPHYLHGVHHVGHGVGNVMHATHAHFPFITAVFSIGKEIKLLSENKTEILVSLTHVGLDLAGVSAGAFGGKVAGGAVGTLILPGVGTAVGMAVGAICGSLLGKFSADKIKRIPAEEAKVEYDRLWQQLQETENHANNYLKIRIFDPFEVRKSQYLKELCHAMTSIEDRQHCREIQNIFRQAFVKDIDEVLVELKHLSAEAKSIGFDRKLLKLFNKKTQENLLSIEKIYSQWIEFQTECKETMSKGGNIFSDKYCTVGGKFDSITLSERDKHFLLAFYAKMDVAEKSSRIWRTIEMSQINKELNELAKEFQPGLESNAKLVRTAEKDLCAKLARLGH